MDEACHHHLPVVKAVTRPVVRRELLHWADGVLRLVTSDRKKLAPRFSSSTKHTPASARVSEVQQQHKAHACERASE